MDEEKKESYFDSEEEKRIVNDYLCNYLPNELLSLENYYNVAKIRNRLKIIYYYGLYKESILYNDFSRLLVDVFSMFPDIYFDSPEEFRNCKYIKLAFVESGV